jgi:hypothetical protein
MNTDTCSGGSATDEIFLSCTNSTSNFIPPCTGNIIAYLVLMLFLIITRSIVVFQQYTIWSYREKNRRNFDDNGNANNNPNRHRGGRRRRYPVVVFNGILTVIILLIITILTSLNIASCNNGATSVLLFLYFAPLLLTGVIYSRRLFALGRKLIPLSKTQLQLLEGQEAKLVEEDLVLKILLFCGRLSTFGTLISLAIVGPILAPSFLPVALGCMFFGLADVFLGSAWVWQLSRLINCVLSAAMNRETDGGRVNSALKLLRFQRGFLALGTSSYALLWFLVAAQVVPFNMYVFWFTLSTETSCASFFALRFSGSSKSQKSNMTSNTTNNNNVVNTDNNNNNPATINKQVVNVASNSDLTANNE